MQIIAQPNDVETTAEQWWFIFDNNNNVLKSPNQCSGKISSPHTLVLANTEQDCLEYINNNNLSL